MCVLEGGAYNALARNDQFRPLPLEVVAGADSGAAVVEPGLAVWVWATARLAEVRRRSQVKRIVILQFVQSIGMECGM